MLTHRELSPWRKSDVFRKVASVAVILAVLLALLAFGVSRMALTLNIGSGAIALVQNGPADDGGTTAGTVTTTLPANSTAGTALVVITVNADTPVKDITAVPPGWVQLISKSATQLKMEIWIYLNNPGGIRAVKFTTNSSTFNNLGHISEWSNVVSASPLEASGSTSSVGGTTLAPTTTGNVVSTGDLAISAWSQWLAAPGAVTYTTPGGWTRLRDNGVDVIFAHTDIEYQINPTTGAPLGPTLTSTGTTNPSAAGAIIVLKKAPPVVNQTAYLKDGSQSIKQNTYDFELIDPATVPSLGDPVVLTNPTWSGRVVSITLSDIVDIASGHKRVGIAATNTTTASATTAPGDLSDGANRLSANQSSLESGTTGWVVDANITIAQSSTFALVGSYSLRMTATAGGNMDTYGPGLGAAGVPVAPTTEYTYSAGFLAGTTLRSCNLNIFWYQASGAASAIRASDAVAANDAVGTWTILTKTITSPSDAAYAAIQALVNSAGAGEQHYLDGVALRPTMGGYLQLEDGSGNYLLEDGSGYYVLEGSAFGYQGLSVKSTQNIDGTTSTYGMVTVFETGYAAGQTITITSANLGLSAVSYTITNVTETFIGIGIPAYVIEFGDAFLTLQQAGGGVLTTQGSTAATQAGVVMPGGVLGYAQVTANQTGITTVVDLTGLTVTVTVGSARRIQITGIALFQDGTIDTQVIMSIQEGATVLTQSAIDQGLAASNQTLNPMVILSPTAGVHTYKLTAQASAGTVQMTAAATTPAFILVQDIGT